MWGKLFGAMFGFMFAKIPGLILGVIVGHMFDRGYAADFNRAGGFGRLFGEQDELKSQAIFFHALFAVMGHVAKASGRVTEQEIRMATSLMDQMQLFGEKRREAQQAFKEGKGSDFPLKQILREFRTSCFGRHDVMQIFLEILIQAAFADGELHPKEVQVLETAAGELGFSVTQLRHLLNMYEAELRFRQHQGQQRQRTQTYSAQQQLSDAYKILGCQSNSSDAEIKKAYRKLMAQHHPDKLASKGLPPEALEMAKIKTQDIQAAYERVRQARN